MKGNKDLVYDFYIPDPIIGLPDNIDQYNKQVEARNKMKIPVEESIKLEDGLHDGEIVDIEYRETPYKYTDVVIKTTHKGKDTKIKSGYPTNINENSALGQLLARFGAKLEIGKDLEVEEFLTKGKKVLFQTTTKGKYSNVISESLKPKE